MASWAVLRHSAKGSAWKDHEYIKKENGKYYYPDGYKGGRHLGGSSKKKSSDTDSNRKSIDDDMEDWEKNIHQHLSKIVEEHKDMFKDGESIKAGILDEKNKDAFKNTLKALTNMDVDKLSDKQLEQMRNKIADFYGKGGSSKTEKKSVKSGSAKASKNVSTSKKKSGGNTAKNIAKLTGAKEDGVKRAMEVGKTKGYDSKEYLEELKKASGGNAEQAKKITESIGESLGHKKKKAKHSVFFVSDNYLVHHGVLGQKWGIRRYQNPDGSLTALGKRRGIADAGENVSNRYKQRSGVYTNVASDLKTTKGGLDAASNAAGRASNVANRAERIREERRKKEIDVSEMSDQELRDKINRMNMERQYRQLEAEKVSAGKVYASDVLATVGDVAAIGASIAGIAAAIYMMKR